MRQASQGLSGFDREVMEVSHIFPRDSPRRLNSFLSKRFSKQKNDVSHATSVVDALSKLLDIGRVSLYGKPQPGACPRFSCPMSATSSNYPSFIITIAGRYPFAILFRLCKRHKACHDLVVLNTQTDVSLTIDSIRRHGIAFARVPVLFLGHVSGATEAFLRRG